MPIFYGIRESECVCSIADIASLLLLKLDSGYQSGTILKKTKRLENGPSMPIFYDGKRGFPAKVNVCAVYSSYCQFTITETRFRIPDIRYNSKITKRLKIGPSMPNFYGGKRGFPAKVNVCAVYSSYFQFNGTNTRFRMTDIRYNP